jgi:hypothetical protein
MPAWALTGVAKAVTARRAAPAMDESLRIQSSRIFPVVAAYEDQRGDGTEMDFDLGISPEDAP